MFNWITVSFSSFICVRCVRVVFRCMSAHTSIGWVKRENRNFEQASISFHTTPYMNNLRYPLQTHRPKHTHISNRQQRRRQLEDDICAYTGLLYYELKSTVHGIVELWNGVLVSISFCLPVCCTYHWNHPKSTNTTTKVEICFMSAETFSFLLYFRSKRAQRHIFLYVSSSLLPPILFGSLCSLFHISLYV